MYKTRVLIISSRKELSIKYKKLIEALGQTVIIASNLSDALDIIQKQEIEFIIYFPVYDVEKLTNKIGV